MKKIRKGFTIVELLVVLAIIGILATIAIINYSSAQKRARDTQRQADLEKIAQALEMYRAETKSYPPSESGGWIKLNSGSLHDALINGKYLDKLPCDDYNSSTKGCATNTGYIYYRKDITNDNGTMLPGNVSTGKPYYGLYATREKPTGSDTDLFDTTVYGIFGVNYVSGLKLP